MAIICPWCAAVVTGHRRECPACGMLLGPLARPEMPAAHPRHRSPLPLWLLVLLPLAGTILLPTGMLVLYRQPVSTVAAVAPRYAEPMQQRVWERGFDALRAAVGPAQAVSLRTSFVAVSAGHLITFCSRSAPGTPEDVPAPRWFLALWGDARLAALQYAAPGFSVLWTRLCTPMTVHGDGAGED